MSKLSFFVCAFLVVSVACDHEADVEAQHKLERARAQCVMSIHHASKAISDKYHNTVDQLAVLKERNAMFEIVREATEKLHELIPVARSAATVEVATDVKTAFGDVVHCREALAILVSEVTFRASDTMDALFEKSPKANVQSTRCRKCMEREIDG